MNGGVQGHIKKVLSDQPQALALYFQSVVPTTQFQLSRGIHDLYGPIGQGKGSDKPRLSSHRQSLNTFDPRLGMDFDKNNKAGDPTQPVVDPKAKPPHYMKGYHPPQTILDAIFDHEKVESSAIYRCKALIPLFPTVCC